VADIRDEIKNYIKQEFPGSSGVDLEDVDLLEEEIVDSLGIFTLVSFIEDKFGVSIDPADINLDNFQNLDTITELVESRK
jgi:acyl carrier protein